MYEWVVFLHVIGAFGFLFSHGASGFVALRLQKERDVERIRSLMDLSSSALNGMWGSALLLLAAGITAGFMGKWWGDGWIWTAIGLLLVISVFMMITSARSYYPLRTAVGLPDPRGKNAPPEGEIASPEEIETTIKAGRPRLLLAVGLGGWLVIVWLMMFKPF